ncbi:transferrin receptor-like dimerization domain-containing protein [Sphingomonas sp.]|uniref:transferrin receptor-like dimerization domain-containing protein n=1 Tax=Sphingomonas sp. TaxID=28214 RepID=UPI002D1BFBDF|nr:transferrin receptor-like dimerization domain-containing protein [Sphingomonas sp.]HWK35475.1 transferrin receptor-like dimerization domain-containing protein [Sphingomonas sp.]
MALGRRFITSAALVALATASVGSGAVAQSGDPKAIEKSFDAQINNADLVAWLKEMSSAPNHVGAPHNKANAEMQLALFKQWGWDARIETFDVLYPTPISTRLEIVGANPVALGGQEAAIGADPDTAKLADALPPYVAYQGDGDVTGSVVYVNYGMPEDYEALERRGISVKGKIVMARYGGGWRGLKPKLAQEHGAIGCLIYSDPADDGYGAYDVYPRGGGRPETGVQRGSVVDMTIYPGDPLTPGIGSTPGAKRLTREESPVLLKIPTLPISYGDAAKIMARLEGPVAGGAARGGMAMTYHWGGTDAVKLHLAVKSDWSQKPIYNVIAVMPGKTRPDEWIVRGNHRDAWVYGASDPLSGQVALMAEAKALGALAKAGWRPDRTLVYASWDGEEPGLLGSTEWAETHADELKAKAVMYINTDVVGRGFFRGDGSHVFQHFVNQVSRDVPDPQTGVSLYDRSRASIRNGGRGVSPEAVAAAKAGADLPIAPLGSGSDFAAFLEHLGVPALNVGFGGEGQAAGAYHSAYDSFHHVMSFDDPGLVYATTLSKVVGRMILRASSGSRPPARYGDFASTVSRYVVEVKKLAADQRESDRALLDQLRDNVFALSSHPDDPMKPPVAKEMTPLIDMLALEDAADRLSRSAKAADAALDRAPAASPAAQAAVEKALKGIDQVLADPRGLPGRPWYRNLIYAPGTLTGYGAKTLPGVREAIEQRRFADARTYVARTAAVLNAYADRLDTAVKALKP